MRRTLSAKILALLCLHGLMLLVHLVWPERVRQLEAPLDDMRIRLLQPAVSGPDPRLALIDIDDDSLAQEGRWPWSRTRIAALIQALQAQSPALIGVDILFPDQADQSDTLAQALQADNITTSLVWTTANMPTQGTLPEQAECRGDCRALPRMRSWITNIPLLQGREQAHISPITDPDGTVRRLFPLVCHPQTCVETLALSLMRQLLGSPTAYRFDASTHTLSSTDTLIRLPLAADASLRIPWYSPDGHAIPWVSARDVLNRQLPDDFLQGRVLILGSSAVGLHDRISTPIAPDYPAVEAHALLLQGLLNQQLWYTPAHANTLAWGAGLIIALALAIALIRQRPRLGLAAALTGVTGWGLFALTQQPGGAFWPLLPVLATTLGTLALLVPWTALDAIRARDILQRQFSHYVAPPVLQRIRRHPEHVIGMEPERRIMTVLFADMRNFSAYAADIDPEYLARVLQIIMDRLTDVIHQHGGTVDKYIGDAVMAFWGAPLADAEHARHATEAARALCAEMDRVAAEYQLPLRLSVGVNSGEVVVGEFGSSHRRSYTLIGAPVNLAAHLEAATRQTPFAILLGPGTRALLPRDTDGSPVDLHLSSQPLPTRAWGLAPVETRTT
ncbi:CHASE2 domain-containing protein [Marinobacterium weihaiense]|uniref:Adenylate/guanylate cyclase domain-containing protein n=1 Tax=Marinobacterium weihaiense TaxID=2851016 RepID=A0ABS6M946_9GAMM|nr:adenylate/guanylate cyclase domain-containing protein [Marinobacterium weihaiense]MBV0932297.1 adenylate/guanylate cyclase domain-containing protein [Marinobacterium weihaiense]